MDNQPKPKLSEVIGGLVASVAYARSVADNEAMRIAYLYHQHELLKGLPVPRLRLQRVSISLPVVVTNIISGKLAQRNPPVEVAKVAAGVVRTALATARQRIAEFNALYRKSMANPGEQEIVSRFEKILGLVDQQDGENRDTVILFESRFARALEQAYLDLAAAEGASASDASIRTQAGETAEAVLSAMISEVIVRYIHEIIAQKKEKGENTEPFDLERAQKTMQGLLQHPFCHALMQEARLATEKAAILAPTSSPDFEVSINTDVIKNMGGGADAVTRLHLVLREEGLEWLSEERDGKETSKLIPE